MRSLQSLYRTAQVHPLALVCLLGLTTLPLPVLAQSRQQTNPGSTTAPTQVEDGYLLGTGDRVRIDFFSVPEYSGEYLVLPNGTINLPQVGAVAVQGRTLRQASTAIAARYEPYLTRPVITISLLAARPATVAIAGEVNRPGAYTVSTAAQNGTGDVGVPTVTRLIQLAGGTTQAADLHNVEVRRSRTGGAEVLKVDLWELIRSGNIQQDLRLQDGDSIFIPTATALNLTEAQQLANTSFASNYNRPVKVAVVGEVNRPGPHLLTNPVTEQTRIEDPEGQVPTVTRAIQVAGGITQSADIRNIQVKRLTKSGQEQNLKVDFWELLRSGDMRQDVPLQDGDTVVIPMADTLTPAEAAKLASASFAPDKITVNIVGEVERPGAIQVPPNTPMNQAILAAGGFNRRASTKSVTFVRLNPDGTVARREVGVDLKQGINDQNNPALRNNDTIVVGRSGITKFSDSLGSVLSPLGSVFGLFRLLGF